MLGLKFIHLVEGAPGSAVVCSADIHMNTYPTDTSFWSMYLQMGCPCKITYSTQGLIGNTQN